MVKTYHLFAGYAVTKYGGGFPSRSIQIVTTAKLPDRDGINPRTANF
jgi:hypothetical protein